jgi:DNA mismatch repair ATPase MutS
MITNVIFTRIGANDNILAGQSTFSIFFRLTVAELRNRSKYAEASQDHWLF